MRLRNRTIIRLGARLMTWCFRALYSTCRIKVIEGAPQTSPYADSGDQRYVYCLWHDGIAHALFCGRMLRGAALTSRHADGDYVAEVMEANGIHPVRGSHQGRGGATAAKQLVTAAETHHIVVTTDGPRGPRRKVKPGIIFLASQSGRPIVPVASSSSRAWRPRGKWTDLLIPFPFSTAYVLGGEPIFIPPNLPKDQLDRFSALLQNEMDALQERADTIARLGLLPQQSLPSNRRAA